MQVARGERGPAPQTITFLSGDVHNSYLAEVTDPLRLGRAVARGAGGVLADPQPDAPGGARRHVAVRQVARAARCGSSPRARRGCPTPAYPWTVTDGPWFDNNIALVTVGREALELTWVTGVVEDDPDRPRLQQVYAARLDPLPGGGQGRLRVCSGLTTAAEHRGRRLALGGQETVRGTPARPGSTRPAARRPAPKDPHDARPTRTASETGERLAAARVEGLSKVYGSGETRVVALDDVTLDLYAGEFTAIMGKSGSGKSTLMHCAAGLDDATSGHVFLGDVDLTTLKEKHLTELRRDRIGFVFQAFNLVPDPDRRRRTSRCRRPSPAAARTPRGSTRSSTPSACATGSGTAPASCPGGQQQRVACARALVGRPDVVFADEPTGNLDSTSGAEVLGFLRRVVDTHGQTVVMVTHDPGAASWTDRVVFLADGRVVDELRAPTPERVLAAMARLDHPAEG